MKVDLYWRFRMLALSSKDIDEDSDQIVDL